MASTYIRGSAPRTLILAAAVALGCAVLAFSIGPAIVLLTPVGVVAGLALRAAWPVGPTRAVALFMAGVAVVAGAYVWWAFDASVAADDAFVPEPACTRFMGLGLIICAAAGVGLFVAGLVGVSTARRRRVSAPARRSTC